MPGASRDCLFLVCAAWKVSLLSCSGRCNLVALRNKFEYTARSEKVEWSEVAICKGWRYRQARWGSWSWRRILISRVCTRPPMATSSCPPWAGRKEKAWYYSAYSLFYLRLFSFFCALLSVCFLPSFFLLSKSSFWLILLFWSFWYPDKHGGEMSCFSCCCHSSSQSSCPGPGPHPCWNSAA